MSEINLNNLATKDDVKSLDSKFNGLSSKVSELDAKVERLINSFFELDKKIDKVDEKHDKQFNQVLDSADKQIKILEEMRAELAAHNATYIRHDEKIEQHEKVLDDHEKRIKVLELKPT